MAQAGVVMKQHTYVQRLLESRPESGGQGRGRRASSEQRAASSEHGVADGAVQGAAGPALWLVTQRRSVTLEREERVRRPWVGLGLGLGGGRRDSGADVKDAGCGEEKACGA